MKNIFVSSTFRDFHRERDMLRNRVMPILNESARTYGEYVSFCDLRWGIDTTEEYEASAEKVLSVCLDEIDRSRPYMVVFLGERYGYVPEKKAISQEVEKRGLNLEDLEISVTQLEIEYGALQNKESLAHTWFYFREIKGEFEQDKRIARQEQGQEQGQEYEYEQEREQEQKYHKKLTELKERIKRLAGNRVHFYEVEGSEETAGNRSFEQLSAMVVDDLKGELMREWEKFSVMNPYEKDNYHQWNYLKEKASHFQVGEAFADEIMAYFEEGKIAVLTGGVGSGKSTYFSHICFQMRENGWDVIPFLCGSTMFSTSEDTILCSIVWQMEKLLQIEHMGNQIESNATMQENYTLRDWQNRLEELCEKYEQTGRKLFLAVDAVNQLFGMENMRSLAFLPRTLAKQIRIFLTSTDDKTVPAMMHVFHVPELKKDDKVAVIEKVLENRGKQLAGQVQDVLLKKSASDNPLFLYLAVNNLCMMNQEDYELINQHGGTMEAINQHQIEIVEKLPDEMEALSANTLYKVAHAIQSDAVCACIEYLAVSRYGLRDSDLEALLKKDGFSFRPLYFAQFMNYMNEMYLLRMDGRYDYLHASLRQGVLKKIAQSTEHSKCTKHSKNTKYSKSTESSKLVNIHRKIAEHLLDLHEQDALRQQELLYHLIHARMEEECMHVISNMVKTSQREQESYLIEDLYQQCMEDKGSWILHLIETQFHKFHQFQKCKRENPEVVLLEELNTFIYFFEIYAKERFYHHIEGVEQYYAILQKIVELLEKQIALSETDSENDATWDSEQWNHILCLGYEMLGETLEKMETAESIAKAGTYYEKVVEYRTEQVEQEKTSFRLMELAIAYEKMGDWINGQGSREQEQKALEIYQSALHLMAVAAREEGSENYIRNYALMAERIGNIYVHRGEQQAMQDGLQCYQQSEQILRLLIAKNPSQQNFSHLTRILCNMAHAYVNLETNEEHEKAIHLYEEAIDCVQQSYENLYSETCRNELFEIHVKMAFAYEVCDGKENLKQALACYEKAFAFAYETLASKKLPTNERNLIRACRGIGAVCTKLGRQIDLETAFHYCHMASDIAKNLVQTNDTERNRLLQVEALMQEGEVFTSIGTEASLKEAFRLYKTGLELLDRLEEVHFVSLKSEDLYIQLLERIGWIYEKLGSDYHLKKALPCYEQALLYTELISKTYGDSPDRQRSIEIDCNKIGNICMRMKEEKENYLNKGISYIEKGLNIARKLSEQYESDKYAWDLSFCYNLYGDALWRKQGHGQEARVYYLQSLEIRKKLDEKQSTLASKKTLMISYGNVVEAYASTEVASDWALAWEYAQKQRVLAEEIMRQEDTIESKMDTAHTYELLAEQCEKLGDRESKYVKSAETYYLKSLEIWQSVIKEVHTYRAYMAYITVCMKTAYFYADRKKTNKADAYFDFTVKEIEGFLQQETVEEYRLTLADVYMQIGEYYYPSTQKKHTEKVKQLYLKSAVIYEEVMKKQDKIPYRANLASIYFGLGTVCFGREEFKDAVRYFQKNIALTEQIPREERTQQRDICLYSSYNRIGVYHLERGEFEQGIAMLLKAISCEQDALLDIKEESAVMEITNDLQHDASLVAEIYMYQNKFELASNYSELSIQMLLLLSKEFPDDYEEALMSQCAKQLQILMVGERTKKKAEKILRYMEIIYTLSTKYPKYKELCKHLQQSFQQYGWKVVLEPNEEDSED